ncbi:hypothetical protein BJX99DRAFT_62210 [Aspergillus californicus]
MDPWMCASLAFLGRCRLLLAHRANNTNSAATMGHGFQSKDGRDGEKAGDVDCLHVQDDPPSPLTESLRPPRNAEFSVCFCPSPAFLRSFNTRALHSCPIVMAL